MLVIISNSNIVQELWYQSETRKVLNYLSEKKCWFRGKLWWSRTKIKDTEKPIRLERFWLNAMPFLLPQCCLVSRTNPQHFHIYLQFFSVTEDNLMSRKYKPWSKSTCLVGAIWSRTPWAGLSRVFSLKMDLLT